MIGWRGFRCPQIARNWNSPNEVLNRLRGVVTPKSWGLTCRLNKTVEAPQPSRVSYLNISAAHTKPEFEEPFYQKPPWNICPKLFISKDGSFPTLKTFQSPVINTGMHSSHKELQSLGFVSLESTIQLENWKKPQCHERLQPNRITIN